MTAEPSELLETPTELPPEPPEQTASDQQVAPLGEQKKFVLCWREPTGSPVLQAALFGSPLLAFAIDEPGNVSVYGDDRRVVYRDSIQGRLFRLATLEDRVLVGTWDGQLYCFGQRELLWQMQLKSPVSALAVSRGPTEIVAGTWDGKIVALRSNGDILWQNQLDDGIASLALAQAGDMSAVGSYAGHLAILDAVGRKLWLRDMGAAVVKVLFTNHARDVVIATQDRMVTRISVENQEIVRELATGASPLDFSLSGNDRRLVMASREGQILVYSVNERTNTPTAQSIAELAQVFILPLSHDGHFVLGLSRRDGMVFLDNRKLVLTVETGEPASCAALAPNGRYMLLGGPEGIALYRLAQPDLRATLVPLGELRKGRFTRLRITLQNTGERTAREIELSLEGHLECTPVDIQTTLGAGQALSSEGQSIQPQADGFLPISIRLKYVDELGIRHEKKDVQMLEVTPDK